VSRFEQIIVIILASVPWSAAAAEAESSVVLGAQYRLVDLAGREAAHVGGVAAGMEWGISDFWNLQATLSDSGGGTADSAAAAGGAVGVQIATLVDATQWVPYLAAGVRGGLLDVGLDADIDPYLEVYGGGGLDYRPRRGWAVGLFGFGGATWSRPGFGASAGAMVTFKMFIPRFE